ncbi:MAG: hypothetical protein MK180_13700 [Rhodobacteraceae bacterium]|nr:hypothetical protein [Paracoccaceae bacterium]
MRRLIEKGLMYGNLVPVRSPALVARYNRALKHLTGRETALGDFHIDISGYSPEVGAELGDDLYLNHNGVNRQFILLSLDQARAPLLNAQFSTSRDILKQFIAANSAELFALTAQDAVAGELIDSVHDVRTPERLMAIGRIKVEADTTAETVRKAARLGEMIDQFKAETDAWYDDVLIAQMIGLAKETGDVVRNPVQLSQMSFEQSDFWTSHFGGLFVFRDVEAPAVLGAAEIADERVIPLSDRAAIAAWLQENALVEPIVKSRGIDAAGIIRQKMDFLLVSHAAEQGDDVAGADRRALRAMARRHSGDLPKEYTGLEALHRWATEGGRWPQISSDHPAYFYALRAADVPQRDLVNRLLAQLAPLDVRQLFICHKELFYQRYGTWPDSKRAFVVDFLAREYQVDKEGARQALFGHEPEMAEPDIIERVGPWGAVRRL